MAVKIVNDVGAPLVVTAVDLATASFASGKYQSWADYIMAVGGYVGAFMGWGGDFVKNVGIASFPLAAERIYDKVRGISSPVSHAANPMTFHRAAVSRYPAPAMNPNMQGVRLV